jgi:hypothetical protein
MPSEANLTTRAPSTANTPDRYSSMNEWLRQVVSLDSAAVALVVAFIDPEAVTAARGVAACSIGALVISLVGAMAWGLQYVGYKAYGDLEYEGLSAVMGGVFGLLAILGFLVGFAGLGLFAIINLLAS